MPSIRLRRDLIGRVATDRLVATFDRPCGASKVVVTATGDPELFPAEVEAICACGRRWEGYSMASLDETPDPEFWEDLARRSLDTC